MGDKKMNRQFWNLWSSYALTYFGRVNLSIVMAALLVVFTDWNLYYVGFVASGFFAAYSIGQFLHGQISERFNPYAYIAVGLALSGIANLLMGFLGGFLVALIVLETFDGFVQAMGWSSIVRANSELHTTKKERSKASTILGCSYQFGTAITFMVSALAVANWGWQAGFFVAAGVLIFRGVTLYLTKPDREFKPKQRVKEQVKLTLTFPIILTGVSLLFVNMVRYGVLTWFFVYLVQSGNIPVAEFFGFDAFKVALIPIAGIIGTLSYNKLPWNKDLTSVLFLASMGIVWLIFPFTDGLTAVVLLLASSAFLYGPHVFLVSTVPSRFKEKGVVAASTGFIDGMGYVGTFIIGLVVPYLVLETGGWNNVFLFWAILSFLAMVTVAVTYFGHFRNNKEENDYITKRTY
jgi:OPA family glycerol-3-phosphate transporter-like MFS transporter